MSIPDDHLELIQAAYERGASETIAEQEREWNATQAREHRLHVALEKGWESHAEMEERRYGTGGRQNFGRPRSTDYQGGPVTWEKDGKEAGE